MRAVLCIAVVVALAPTTARANVAARVRRPGVIGGPALAGKTVLTIEREALRFECHDTRKEPACNLSVLYLVRNPTRRAEEVVAAFYGIRSSRIRVTLDGAPVGRKLSKSEIALLDRASFPSKPSKTARRRLKFWLQYVKPQRVGFDLRVPAGATRRLAIEGIVTAGKLTGGRAYTIPAYLARHPFFESRPQEGTYHLDYLLSPSLSWAKAGPIAVSVRYPAAWSMRGGVAISPLVWDGGEKEIRWKRRVVGKWAEASATVQASDGARLAISFEHDARELRAGGPLVGLGAALGGKGFRMRLGYEIAYPRWLLYSLNFDTNFDDRLVVAPVVEAVTPFMLLLPWVGVGMGLPVRLQPTTDVGIRFQASLGYGPLALVSSFDLFPGADSAAGERFRVTLLAQLSF